VTWIMACEYASWRTWLWRHRGGMRLEGWTLLNKGGTVSFHASSSDVRRIAVSRGESRERLLIL
jgi:hypothetical protein